MGLQATLRRAQETAFWPHINADVKNIVETCDSCRTFKPERSKQPLQSHDIIDERWAKVAADLLQRTGNDYLITVDYLTNFREVDNLSHDSSTAAVINKLRQHFARYWAPIELVTDNGPQFASAQFEAFARRWRFQHIPTSPYYPQSNGKGESAVKTTKDLMRKAAHSSTDVWLGVLEYQNTPSLPADNSPVE